jgi:VanZ family protein
MIFYLSSRSDLPAPSLFMGLDKLAHALVFGILGFLISRSFKLRGENVPFSRVLLITLMVAIYGGFDEAHQLFVSGRVASIGDFIADTGGGLVSALVCWKKQ